MVRVHEVMGTVFSFDIRPPFVDAGVLDGVVRWLHVVDATFSTYRFDSIVNRLDRCELTLDQCPDAVQEVMARCAALHRESFGHFDVRATGRVDPSGFVKGWAVEGASRMLLRAGALNHTVNGGGDVRARGEPEPGRPWRLGIADPADRMRCLAVVESRDVAVATSGTYERGAHVVDPVRRRPATELVSLTVIARDGGTADGLATAAFAMGNGARPWLEGRQGVQALAVDREGRTWRTSSHRVAGDPAAWVTCQPGRAAVRLPGHEQRSAATTVSRRGGAPR